MEPRERGLGRGATGREKVFRFNSAKAGRYCFDTRGARFDTVLHVREADCDAGREIRCNDNRRRLRRRSALSFRAEAGQDYFVFVDGKGRGAGQFVLNVSEGGCRRVLKTPVRPQPVAVGSLQAARPAPSDDAPQGRQEPQR